MVSVVVNGHYCWYCVTLNGCSLQVIAVRTVLQCIADYNAVDIYTVHC